MSRKRQTERGVYWPGMARLFFRLRWPKGVKKGSSFMWSVEQHGGAQVTEGNRETHCIGWFTEASLPVSVQSLASLEASKQGSSLPSASASCDSLFLGLSTGFLPIGETLWPGSLRYRIGWQGPRSRARGHLTVKWRQKSESCSKEPYAFRCFYLLHLYFKFSPPTKWATSMNQ